MCDYSVTAEKTRPAIIGEKLTTHRLSLGTTGFVPAVEEPGTAVCLLPGTELAFETAVAYKGPMGFYTNEFIQGEHSTAIFRQVDKDKPSTHHDCLEFPNGTTVFLNQLCENQTASVLQLPAKPKTDAEVKEQTRAEFVG